MSMPFVSSSDPTPCPSRSSPVGLPARSAPLHRRNGAGMGIGFEGEGGGLATPFSFKKPPLPLAGAPSRQDPLLQGEGQGGGSRRNDQACGYDARTWGSLR